MTFRKILEKSLPLNTYEKDSLKRIIYFLSKKVKNNTDLLFYRNDEIDFNYDQFMFLLNQVIKKNMPIEFVLKTISFCQSDYFICKNVFLPRKETEMVIWDIFFKYKINPKRILDLCSGSGIPTCALKKFFLDSEITAIEIDDLSIFVSRQNSFLYGLDILWVKEDIFNFLNIQTTLDYDFVFFNPPYIDKKTLLEESLNYDNQKGLWADFNGFEYYFKFFKNFFKKFKTNTKFLVEIDKSHVNFILELFKEINLNNFKIEKDIYGISRFILINF